MKTEKKAGICPCVNSVHERVSNISHNIRQLKNESKAILQSTNDAWTPLGRRAPLLREAFKGVGLPVKSRDELITKMGGVDRVIIAPSLDGTLTAVSALDLLDSIGEFLTKVLPVKSWEGLVNEIVLHEATARKKKVKTHLLRNISSKHLREITANPKRHLLAFPDQIHRKYHDAFERELPQNSVFAAKFKKSVNTLVHKARAHHIYIGIYLNVDVIIILIQALAEAEQANIVVAKTASARTYLDYAEQLLHNADGYLNNVIGANTLTTTIKNYNTQAKSALDSANQLIAQAVADIAAAEATLQLIPGNAQAQSAVAEAHARLEDLQGQLQLILTKMSEAEKHKDVLAIPIVCITIRCIETDPCCDDDWNDVNVCITNNNNSDVLPACGTTSGNGSVTICGRFGDSEVTVTSTGPGGWNETRVYHVGSHSESHEISTDLSGLE